MYTLWLLCLFCATTPSPAGPLDELRCHTPQAPIGTLPGQAPALLKTCRKNKSTLSRRLRPRSDRPAEFGMEGILRTGEFAASLPGSSPQAFCVVFAKNGYAKSTRRAALPANNAQSGCRSSGGNRPGGLSTDPSPAAPQPSLPTAWLSDFVRAAPATRPPSALAITVPRRDCE